MKKIILVIVCLISSVLSKAQSSSFQWAKSIGGSNNDYGNLITTDASGNVYTYGTFIGSLDFDPGAGTTILNSSSGTGFILKMDALGNFLWARNFGYTVTSMKINNSTGNLITTGYFQNTVDFDIGAGTFLMSGYATNGYEDIFISAIDLSGNFVWAKHIGGNFIDKALDLDLDATGNIYYTGQFGYGADFDPSASTFTLSCANGANSGTDIFISKLDASGNFIWAKGMGGIYQDAGSVIKTNINGNIYAIGYFTDAVDFDPSAGTFIMNSGSTNNGKAYVSEFDASGNFIWAESFDGLIASVAIDGANNLFITGSFTGTIDFDLGVGVYNLTSNSGGYNDIFILKLNALGNFIWAKNIGGNSYDFGKSITLDAMANIYITGSFSGTVDFNTSPSIYNLSTNGGDDVFISKLDSTGSLIWAKNFGGFVSDVGNAIALDVSGNLYTTGFYGNGGSGLDSCDFNPEGGVFNLLPAHGPDAFIHKMSPCTVPLAPVNTTNILNQTICSGSSAELTASSASPIFWHDATNLSITLGTTLTFTTPILASGTYTYYAEPLSCSLPNSRVAITVTVNNTPTPTISVNSGSICIGQSFTIVPSGANTYTFSSGSAINTPTTTTNYTITGTASNGCVNNIGSISNVYVTAAPSLTLTANPSSLCTSPSPSGGTTATLTATPYGSWDTFSTGSNIYVSPTATKVYTATASNAVCSITKTITLTVFPLTTINVVGSNSVCSGYSLALTASGANTYTWDNGAQGPNYYDKPVNSWVGPNGTDSNNCLCFGAIYVTSYPACVWPGDVNNDGIANNLDVLELGLHYTTSGTQRPLIGNLWAINYGYYKWFMPLSNGKDLSNSDCNGDGIINDDDTLAIFNNYGSTHAFKPEQATTNSVLTIAPDQSSVAKGTWGTSSIYLGDATTSINNINGIAYTVSYDNTLLETDSVWIEYPTSFINASNQNLKFRKWDFSNGKLYTATTHTISGNVSGNGKIATLHYKIKSSLTADNVMNLSISQANQSDAYGTITPLTAGSATLMALGTSIATNLNALTNGNYISLHPNPTNGVLTINSTTELQKIEVMAITGQLLMSEVPASTSHVLHLDHLANGVYFVNLYQNNRIVKREKIILHK